MNVYKFNDKARVEALDHVVKTEYGYVDDLIQKVGDKIFNELCSVGFISIGYTKNKKTWRISHNGKEYCALVVKSNSLQK